MNKKAERVQLIRDTTQFKKTNRTPVFGNIWTYKVYDAGYTLKEALTNYDVMEKCVRECFERYNMDMYMENGTRNPMRVGMALGNYFHRIDENDRLYVVDHHLMEPEEYELMQNSPVELGWSRELRRLNPDMTIGQFQNAMAEMVGFAQFQGRIAALEEEYGVTTALMGLNAYFTPWEFIVLGHRGIKNSSMDLRRHKEALKGALTAMHERTFPVFKAKLTASDPTKNAFDAGTVFLGHSLLSTKQFGEFYWPYLKQVIDEVIAQNKTIFIFCEASLVNFIDYFATLPKGHVAIHLEQDDIFEIRKALPNIALAGGMPSSLLADGTKEECVDYAKMLVDKMGEGYFFSQDKMLSYKDDAKRENLMAVSEFVRNYTR